MSNELQTYLTGEIARLKKKARGYQSLATILSLVVAFYAAIGVFVVNRFTNPQELSTFILYNVHKAVPHSSLFPKRHSRAQQPNRWRPSLWQPVKLCPICD